MSLIMRALHRRKSSEDALVCKILSDVAAIMKTGQTRKL